MSEDILTNIYEVLMLQNDLLVGFSEDFSSLIFTNSIITILLSLGFGAFIGYILFRFLKG